jgi:hypothetical protein
MKIIERKREKSSGVKTRKGRVCGSKAVFMVWGSPSAILLQAAVTKFPGSPAAATNMIRNSYYHCHIT